MKNARFGIPVLFAISLLSLLSNTGCTVAGFAIGAAIDNKQPKKEKTISAAEAAQLKPRTLVAVHRIGADPVVGRFQSLEKMRPATDTTLNSIMLEKKGATLEYVKIPLDKIDHIHVPARNAKGKILGPIIGLAVDFGVAILAVRSINIWD